MAASCYAAVTGPEAMIHCQRLGHFLSALALE